MNYFFFCTNGNSLHVSSPVTTKPEGVGHSYWLHALSFMALHHMHKVEKPH